MISNGLEAFHVNSDVLGSIEETCLLGFVHASALLITVSTQFVTS